MADDLANQGSLGTDAAIAVNTRVLVHPTAGMGRYTSELLDRFEARVHRIAPTRAAKGIRGHAWEQAVLPRRVHDRLLWSPANTGPLEIRHQVVTIHDLIPVEFPQWFDRRFALWYRFLLPRLVLRAAAVIAISEFTKGRLLSLTDVPEDRITVIHNGVDRRFVPATAPEVDRARNAVGIPFENYILSVCTLEPRKNLARLLEAWMRVPKKDKAGVGLVLVGVRGSGSVFRDAGLPELPDDVYVTGYVADDHLPHLYSGALALAYPSLYEGFGLPPLEAMACGCPVITSNAASLPEVCGDAAQLVDPENVEAISQSLRDVIGQADLRASMRAKGLSRAGQFSWDEAARRTWQVLETVAQEGRRD